MDRMDLSFRFWNDIIVSAGHLNSRAQYLTGRKKGCKGYFVNFKNITEILRGFWMQIDVVAGYREGRSDNIIMVIISTTKSPHLIKRYKYEYSTTPAGAQVAYPHLQNHHLLPSPPAR